MKIKKDDFKKVNEVLNDLLDAQFPEDYHEKKKILEAMDEIKQAQFNLDLYRKALEDVTGEFAEVGICEPQEGFVNYPQGLHGAVRDFKQLYYDNSISFAINAREENNL